MELSMRRAAFTLIELLAVTGIITLLLALFLPTLSKARQAAWRTQCRASLYDIGQRFQMYLQDSRDRLPLVNTMPSVRPPLNAGPSLVQLLAPYSGGAHRSYCCPADHITRAATGAPSGYETYFEREGTSYQYNPFLSAFFAGQNLDATGITKHPERMVLVSDYEPFHGLPGGNSAMNALFLDSHVADLSDFVEP